MKGIQKRLGSLLMAAVMLLSLAVTPAMAADTQNPPTQAPTLEDGSFFYKYTLKFGYRQSAWAENITGIQVNQETWTKADTVSSVGNKNYYIQSADAKICFGEGLSSGENTCVISANGYKPLTLCVNTANHTVTVVANSGGTETSAYNVTVASTLKNGQLEVSPTTAKQGETVTVTANPETGYVLDTLTATGVSGAVSTTQDSNDANKYTFIMPAENVTVSATFKASAPAEDKTITISDISFATDFLGQKWLVSFGKQTKDFTGEITGVSVNGKAWTKQSYAPSSGGAYYANDDGQIVFAAKEFSSNPTVPVLKSGDVITITADGYKDLTFKLVIDTNGKASVAEDDGQGDPYELHVKIEGSFEAAIVGQKNYDGVSSASTGGASSNKNSAVTVYGALTKKGTKPADSDWEELNRQSAIRLEGNKCSVSIVPDTEKETATEADSGMEGVYMTISSDLTLSGTPKDAGSYLISIHVEDNQGRKADSNTLPFRIYTGEETLANQIRTENLKRYESGLYA